MSDIGGEHADVTAVVGVGQPFQAENAMEVATEFQRQNVRETYGFSLLPDLVPLFNDVIITDKFQNCIFSSGKSIALICTNVPESERFFTLDGTFRITPKGVWQQTLILHASFGSKSFPLAYALMSKRTIEAYESVFRFINENLIPLRGEAIIIDFEKAVRKALILVLKSIKSALFILGCWFHFCQAIRRKVSQMPALYEKIKKDPRYKDIFRRFQCLPLLQLHHIEGAFRDLSKEALSLDQNSFAPFVDYFYKEWIQIVKPKHFCVYMRGKRTTGDAESCNGRFNQLFKAHSGFFQFCETLQKVEATSTTQLMNYVDGTQQKSNVNTFYLKRSKLIKKLSFEHRDNPKLLLKLLANTKNKLLFPDSDIPIATGELPVSELFGNEDDVIYKEVVDSDESDTELSDEHVTIKKRQTKKTRSRKDKEQAIESEPTKQNTTRVAAKNTVPEIGEEDRLNFSGLSGISHNNIVQ